MAKSLFCIADRLEGDILRDTPENFIIIEEIVESQYAASKEMQNEILTDCVKTILQTPSYLLKKDLKFIEYIKRVVIIGLEEARSQNIHLVMNIIGVLDKILVQGVIEFTQGREEFLEDVLPFFGSLLVLEDQKKKQEFNHSLTIEEAFLTRAEILDRIIRFLGSLGSESKYMTKNRQDQQELEVNEGEALMITLPLHNTELTLNLNQLIERSSFLAIESLDQSTKSAASELLHASMVVLIGKCSQGNQLSQDFVQSIEKALPSIMKLATNDANFSMLFRELILQISRWLAHNKEEENQLVSCFIATILELAGQADKPEQRSLCLECLRELLSHSIRNHGKVSLIMANFNIFMRKIEGLSMHPDAFRRLAGLMSIKQLLSESIRQPKLMQSLFFDICYFFFVLVRTNDRQNGDHNTNDCQIFCEDIFSKLL